MHRPQRRSGSSKRIAANLDCESLASTIQVFAQWLIKSKLAGSHLLDRIETEVAAEIKQAATFALAAPYPDADEVDQHVYA